MEELKNILKVFNEVHQVYYTPVLSIKQASDFSPSIKVYEISLYEQYTKGEPKIIKYVYTTNDNESIAVKELKKMILKDLFKYGRKECSL